jgi:hypothetical protein
VGLLTKVLPWMRSRKQSPALPGPFTNLHPLAAGLTPECGSGAHEGSREGHRRGNEKKARLTDPALNGQITYSGQGRLPD